MACWTFTDYRDALLSTGIFGGRDADERQAYIANLVKDTYLLSSPTYSFITNNGTSDIDLTRKLPLVLGENASSSTPLIFLCQSATSGKTWVGFKKQEDVDNFKSLFTAGFKYIEVINDTSDCKCQVLDSFINQFSETANAGISFSSLLNQLIDNITNTGGANNWAYVNDFVGGAWHRSYTKATLKSTLLSNSLLSGSTWYELTHDAFPSSEWNRNPSLQTNIAKSRAMNEVSLPEERLAAAPQEKPQKGDWLKDFPKPRLRGGNMLKVGWPTPASSDLMTSEIISGGLSAVMNAAQAAYNSTFNNAQTRLAAAFKQPIVKENKVNDTDNPCMSDILCFGQFLSSDRNSDVNVVACFSGFTTPLKVTAGPSIKDLKAIRNTMNFAYQQLLDDCNDDTNTAPIRWDSSFNACFILKGLESDANKPTTEACCDGISPYARPTITDTPTEKFEYWSNGDIWSSYTLFTTAEKDLNGNISPFKFKKYSYAQAFLNVIDMLKRAVISKNLFKAIEECYRKLTNAMCASETDPVKLPAGEDLINTCEIVCNYYNSEECKVSMQSPELVEVPSLTGIDADKLSRYPDVKEKLLHCESYKFDICTDMIQTYFDYYANMIVVRNMERYDLKASCTSGDCAPTSSVVHDDACCTSLTGAVACTIWNEETGMCERQGAPGTVTNTPCDLMQYVQSEDCKMSADLVEYSVAVKSYYAKYPDPAKSCLLHTVQMLSDLGANYEIPFLGTGFINDLDITLNPNNVNINDNSYTWVEPSYNEDQGASISSGKGNNNDDDDGGGGGGGGEWPDDPSSLPSAPSLSNKDKPGLYVLFKKRTTQQAPSTGGTPGKITTETTYVFERCDSIQWRQNNFATIISAMSNIRLGDVSADSYCRDPSSAICQITGTRALSGVIHAIGVLKGREYDSTDANVKKRLYFLAPFIDDGYGYKYTCKYLDSNFAWDINAYMGEHSPNQILLAKNVGDSGNQGITVTANCSVGNFNIPPQYPGDTSTPCGCDDTDISPYCVGDITQTSVTINLS